MNKSIASVQDRVYTDSSRAKQTRQLNQDEQHFAAMLARMQAGGELPTDEEIDQAGALAGDLAEMRDSLELDGIPGLSRTLQALTANPKNKIASLLAIIEEQKEQDQAGLPEGLEIGKAGRPVYKTYTEDEIDLFPDIEYLASGILQTATVSMLYGESNTGKTFVGLHLAQCVARGRDWLGRPVKQGRVLYIYAEGKLGLKRRVQAWREHYKLPPTTEVRYILQPVHLVDNRQFLIDTIEDQDQAPALVIVDTFSNCSIGTNQNDQMEVAKVLNTGHDITRRYGSHFLVIHHTNKAGGVNGSAAFRNHVDTMIELSREGKDGALTLRCEKQRDAAYFSDIRLALQVVDLGIDFNTCEVVSSCVVTVDDSAPATKEDMTLTQQKMLDILEMHGRLSFNRWKEECKAAGIVKDTGFYNNSRALADKGKVTKDASGDGKHTWYSIAISGSSPSSQTSSPELVNLEQN